MGAIGELSLARFRHRPGRWLIVAAGVALALALPVLAAATGRAVAIRTLGAAIDALPPGERTVIAAYGGTPDPSAQAHDDGLVRAGIARLTDRPVVQQMLYGELADSVGGTYRLAASADLAHQVRVTSGRLPSSCTPTRCEVLRTGPGDPPVLDPALGLVVVGTGVRTDPLLLPGTFDPGPAARVLLGASPDSMQRLAALEQFPRGAGWVAALDPARITSLGVPAYADLSRQVSDDLGFRIRALTLAVPDDALLREDARASTSRGRFAVLGGTTAVLALGFVLVAAAGLRREHGDVAALLRRRGASATDVARFALLGASAAVAVGALVGIAAGWIGAWVVATAQPWHPPGSTLATAAVLDALPTLALLAICAVAVTTAVLVWPATRASTAWHVVELLAVVTAAVALLVAARGAVGVATVAGDPLAIALPVLVLTCAALVAARVFVPVASAASRHLPVSAVAARLAAASGVRRPLRTAVTVGFVTAAVGSVVFAGSYRATLASGSADTAAFEVPTAATLTVGPQGADPVALTASAPLPGPAYAVLRTVAGVRTSATSADAVALLGVDPASLGAMDRWDRTVGASDGSDAAAAITASPSAPGIAVAEGARTLSIPVSSWTRSEPGEVDVVAWVSAPDGRERGVRLALTRGSLVGPLPDLGPGVRLTALTLRENPNDATRRLHRSGEGSTAASFLAGRLALGPPAQGGGGWATWSSRTAEATATPESLSLSYTLSGPLVVVRPGLATRPPVRVLVDPTTASRGGTLRLDLGGGDAVPATVVGSLPRFPSTGPRFVVADRVALSAALDDHEPGTGAPREIWAVAAPALPQVLAASPYDQVVVRSQDARRAALEADPVGQGGAWLLLLAAAIALLVAVLALVMLVIGERRDDAGQLFAQEADGVAPSTLRRSLWWRSAAVALPALVVGAGVGLLLTRSVATLVALSASGTTPVPPLLPAVGATGTAVVLVAGVLVALSACAVVAARTLRDPWPARPDQDLR